MCFIALSLIFIFYPSYTPKIRRSENSIAELTSVSLGNSDQTIMIRGEDITKPVILFLHGGPGYPFISYARGFQSQLEKNFVVVNWDQRGSGKSYSFRTNEETMNQEQFEKDTIELIEYLCKRFTEEKIYLVGHSWGTVLGIEATQNVPDKIHAYVGIGQVVDNIEGEKCSYNYVYNKALEENNQEAISDLEGIGEPPYKDTGKDTFVQRKWLKKYGGFEMNIKTQEEMIKGVLFKPEYSLLDGIKLLIGNQFTIDTLYSKREMADFREKYIEYEVPVYFCGGRYDYNTPSDLVEEYYKIIKAPKKDFYWFEKSAHEPHLVEEDKFNDIMINIYKETYLEK